MALCEDVPNRAQCLRQHLKNQSLRQGFSANVLFGSCNPRARKVKKKREEVGKDGNQLKVVCDCFVTASVYTYTAAVATINKTHHQLFSRYTSAIQDALGQI